MLLTKLQTDILPLQMVPQWREKKQTGASIFFTPLLCLEGRFLKWRGRMTKQVRGELWQVWPTASRDELCQLGTASSKVYQYLSPPLLRQNAALYFAHLKWDVVSGDIFILICLIMSNLNIVHMFEDRLLCLYHYPKERHGRPQSPKYSLVPAGCGQGIKVTDSPVLKLWT